MYYEVILRNGESFFFDTEAEADKFAEAHEYYEIYVRGEFPEYY